MFNRILQIGFIVVAIVAFGHVTGAGADGNSNGIAHRVAALEATVASQAAEIVSQQGEIDDLNDLLADVVRLTDPNTGEDTLRFGHAYGMNVQVVNGTGTTDGTPNGTGNLIVGYNAKRGAGDDRSGSHMLVAGDWHNYSSFGGAVLGIRNTVSGIWSSVTGGGNNLASGEASSVSGGAGNRAIGKNGSVSGGRNNDAYGYQSSVSGGADNNSMGFCCSVNGGSKNSADGNFGSVSGGENNKTNGDRATVSGGRNNDATYDYSTSSGGNNNDTTAVDDHKP